MYNYVYCYCAEQGCCEEQHVAGAQGRPHAGPWLRTKGVDANGAAAKVVKDV